MSDDLKNILSNLNNEIEQEKLLEYLNRKLSVQEQHELEKHLNDDEFMSDAMDGLQHLNNKTDVTLLVQQLNVDLKKQLDKSKRKNKRRTLKTDSSVYYTIAFLLILAVIGFVVIKMLLKN